ncbi:MAG: hypothetical protein AAGA44_03625 [Pseudomonadota bacterium]
MKPIDTEWNELFSPLNELDIAISGLRGFESLFFSAEMEEISGSDVTNALMILIANAQEQKEKAQDAASKLFKQHDYSTKGRPPLRVS